MGDGTGSDIDGKRQDGARGRAGASREGFGILGDGTAVEAVVLRNGRGTTARLIGFGAALQSLHVPDRHGRLDDVVLGYATLAEYVEHPQYFGATIGRYGNRLAGGRFVLDGRTVQVPATDGPNALHGGVHGFDQRCWEIETLSGPGEVPHVAFRRTSPDGEEGFPGRLFVRAGYTLGEDDTLTLDYAAATDASTVVNLTNHSFFNLCGEGSGRSALDHLVTIHADAFTPVDGTMIPTGEIRPVSGTAMDFTAAGGGVARIRDGAEPQLVLGRGYDHTFVLRGGVAPEPRPAVRVEDPRSGRVLEIATTEPGVQFYSGNFLDGTRTGKAGLLYRQGDGLCFEAQHFPDAPNHPTFPSTRLDPGQTFRSRTVWRFTTSQN